MKTELMINSIIETKHILNLLQNEKRLDGRKLFQYRDIQVQTNIIKKADGSARVRLGKSMVYAGVKAELGAPFPDTPDKGVLIVNIELSPIASPFFESGPPTKESIELARVVDRTIRESEVIDVDKLCVIPGQKVWLVFVDIYALADDGNMIYTATLGAMAALATAKLPKMIPDPENKEKLIKSEEKEPLPIKTFATSMTFSKIGNKMLLDPLLDEEKVEDARFTVGISEESFISAMQKGLVGTFTTDELFKLIEVGQTQAIERIKSLKQIIKNGGNWPSEGL